MFTQYVVYNNVYYRYYEFPEISIRHAANVYQVT